MCVFVCVRGVGRGGGGVWRVFAGFGGSPHVQGEA